MFVNSIYNYLTALSTSAKMVLAAPFLHSVMSIIPVTAIPAAVSRYYFYHNFH